MLCRVFPGTLDYWLTTDDERMIATAVALIEREATDDDQPAGD